MQPGPVRALGFVLGERLAASGAPRIAVLGGDTRDSTPALCAWLVDGLEVAGTQCLLAGVVPTPAVSRLAPLVGAGLGIAVSASHNLHPDNGIKLVGPSGRKWPISEEAELEQRLLDRLDGASGLDPEVRPEARPDVHGTQELAWSDLTIDPTLGERYLDELRATLPASPLAGLHVVLDAANGAASSWAGRLFDALGARVDLHHTSPDGRNINHGCGSNHPEVVAAQTVSARADLGIAFDGDADRSLICDEHGTSHDGDAMLFLWASELLAQGRMSPPVVVATSMSNLGLERALERLGVRVIRCDVGDRQVVESMRQNNAPLGGEQSGHLVCAHLSETGDGLLTAAHLAWAVSRSGLPLSRLLSDFQRFPQLLRGVPVQRRMPINDMPELQEAWRNASVQLGEQGRIVIRFSGTEPLLRIMLEGPQRGQLDVIADRLEEAALRDLQPLPSPLEG